VFDFRYHVASLTAVLLALVIGILVGVGISGRGFVDEAERTRLNSRITGLSEELLAARERSADLRRQQDAAQDFVQQAYPVLVEDRLAGKTVAVVVVGSLDRPVTFVERAIDDAGGRVVRMRALTVPVVREEVEQALAGDPALAAYLGAEHLTDLGRDLGRELVDGAETPLSDALAAVLVEQQFGPAAAVADAVVVVRTAEPQAGETARFLAALYGGLRSTGVPVVGADTSDAEISALPTFRRHRLSTVDDVETAAGRLALVLLLGGAEPGHYGVREDADDGILPPIEPLPVVAGG
jgi:hypothetical protein